MNIPLEAPPHFLAVDSDLERAQLLMDAVQSYCREARVTVTPNLDEAHRDLFNSQFTAVVLTPDYSEEDLKLFIDSGRKTFGGQDSAYVMLVEEEDQNEEILALGMLAGVNGFLFSPFSADGVNNTFLLAKKLKTERIERSQKEEIAMALRAAKQQIDLFSAALTDCKTEGIFSGRFDQLRSRIDACVDKNSALFFRMLVGSFIWETKEPPATGALNYRGGSGRVRKYVAGKAKKKLNIESDSERE